MRVFRRWLNRGKPYTCRLCGFTVPVFGSRRGQAEIAFDHWEDVHEQEGEKNDE